MNSAIELHDSTLAGVEVIGLDVVVRLAPAYIHRSTGLPGSDPVSGWHLNIDLIITGAIAESRPSRMPCWIADGVLSFGEANWDNIIPLPLEGSGAVSLSAITVNRENLLVLGLGAEAVARGEPRYVEPFPGTA